MEQQPKQQPATTKPLPTFVYVQPYKRTILYCQWLCGSLTRFTPQRGDRPTKKKNAHENYNSLLNALERETLTTIYPIQTNKHHTARKNRFLLLFLRMFYFSVHSNYSSHRYTRE